MKIKYTCAVCGKELNRILPHLRSIKNGELRHGITPKEYYDTYIAEQSEHLCEICGSPASFNEATFQYNSFCDNRSCRFKLRWKHNKENFKKRTGYENNFQLPEIKEKCKQKYLEKFGVDNPMKSAEIQEKSKQTCLQKYGVEYFTQTDIAKEKSKQTCLERYGVEYSFQDPGVREKGKKTCIEKYGENYRKFFGQKSAESRLQNGNYTGNLEEAKQKSKQTCLERYGKDNYSKTDEFLERYKKVCLEKFGTEYFLQSKEYLSKRKEKDLQKTYENLLKIEGYDLISFDSHDAVFKHKECRT